jgi:hypothetical protein
MKDEYDFTGGVRGKYAEAMKAGYTITIHNEDGTTLVKEVPPEVPLRKISTKSRTRKKA